MDQDDILYGLGFIRELKKDEYERWRHYLSDNNDVEFALIIYIDNDIDDTLRLAEKMLRKIGQQQKIEQISKFIE
jgi:hypothetical protein